MSHQLVLPWLTPAKERPSARRAGRVLAPRMAAAAVRIPEFRHEPLPFSLPGGPRIFVHEGARQALERRLELALGRPVHLAVTDNLRRMVTHSQARGALRVRVHMMFLGAPERVVSALVEYVASGERGASIALGEFIESNRHRIRASQPVPGPLKTRGKVHDLGRLLESVNVEYFAGSVNDVLVTWGRRTSPRGETRSTIKLGSYSATERLIRVHPAIDRAWVPRYFLKYILYHELLHHFIPSVGRAPLHPPELLRRERDFKDYERAIAWEQKNISRLLRVR